MDNGSVVADRNVLTSSWRGGWKGITMETVSFMDFVDLFRFVGSFIE